MKKKRRLKTKYRLMLWAFILIILILVSALLFVILGGFKKNEEPDEDPNTSSGTVVIIPVEESSSESESMQSEENNTSSATQSETEREESTSSESQSESKPESEKTSSVQATEAPGNYDTLILVGPKNYIPDDYTVNLVNVQGKYNLDEKAAESAKELLAAAKKAGFDMRLCSAYRTKEKSAELFQKQVNKYLNAGYSEERAKTEAAKWVAPPGTSEHHTGLSMDLVSADYWNYYSDLEHDYEKFDSFKWMYEHCAEFGFILRFPKDKQDITGITYEPWHYRYVGKEAAKYIMENKICLEEYLEIIK